MVELLGHDVIVHGRAGASPGADVTARVAPARPPEPGAPLALHADVDALQLFDADTGRRFAA
jgi:hypothetical protein